MEIFGRIRQKIGNIILAKKIIRIKRKVYYLNIENIRKIGIVWDASRSEDFSSLSKFQQKMHERNIGVEIIGYYPGEELPGRLTAIKYLSCIRKQELSFFYQPVTNDSEKFVIAPFDVLIDINFEKKFPLHYISALSAASFKVGLYDSDERDKSIFDLMIELKKPVHIDNYLEMINSGSSDENAKKIIDHEKI